MVRKHGWQLPAHTFQVVAITVFCLLVVAFYAFFAPFLGGQAWEYALIATYSPVAALVFVLYVRCTAINPADPGIMSKFDSRLRNGAATKHGLSADDLPQKFDECSIGGRSSLSSTSKSSIAATNSNNKGSFETSRNNIEVASPITKSSCWNPGKIFCAICVHEDCRKQESITENEATGEDALFCTLCDSEVRKFSKHCRSCDKCVDGFDHHCRWLNNCVGRKNYMTFITLMALSLIWLVIEATVGIAVLVRCFVNKRNMEAEIVDRLGNGFSRAPFAAVVAVCTALSVLACVPLGELFFFHMILIRKGITTYEYVVAMRTMSEAPAGASIDEELPNILNSPTGSATTGFSGGSSLGLQYKGAWCTPPRVFVDYQEEVAPHLEPGMVPSTVDPDAAAFEEKGNKLPKKSVRISAWKLAKLDSGEAMRAAAKARASSSVLRPVDNRRLPDSELSSSGNMSVRSSVSGDTGVIKDGRNELRFSPFRNSFAPSQGSRDEYETGTQTASTFSSPSHAHEAVTLSPLPQAHGFNRASSVGGFPPQRPLAPRNLAPAGNEPIPQASSGFDGKLPQKSNAADPLLLYAAAPSTSLLRDVKRTSVVWDQEAGRYVSIPVSASDRNKPSLAGPSNSNVGMPNSEKRLTELPLEPPQPDIIGSQKSQKSDKLLYAGESIFFGGPLLSAPVRESLKNERDLSGRDGQQDRLTFNMPKESKFKRDGVSNQLPVFVLGNYDQNLPSGSHT